MALFESSGERIVSGILLVAIAVVLIISGVGWFNRPIISYEADTILAFLALFLGTAVLFSESSAERKK